MNKKWIPFFLDTNLYYTGLIDSKDSWKNCVVELKSTGKFEEMQTTRQQGSISKDSPVARFGFQQSTGKTLKQFFEENELEINPTQ
jgi:cell envelope opacity-associated protein A